jgi:hypothetical protein
MRRTHRATAAVVDALLADFEAIHNTAKKTERTRRMQDIAYPTLHGWDLSTSGSAAARVDAIGMIESYVQQLADGRETASPPTVPPLEGREIWYKAALDTLAATRATVHEKSALRNELNRMARLPGPRPLSLQGYRHFYLLLRHPETRRLYAWVNLLPITSRLAPTRAEAYRHAREDVAGDMIEVTTGEVMRCKRPTWMLFPLKHGFDFHEREFRAAENFCCVRCSHKNDADRNAARIVTIKRSWLLQVPTKTSRGDRDLRDDEKFPQYLLDAIRCWGMAEGQRMKGSCPIFRNAR